LSSRSESPLRRIERIHAWYGALGCTPYNAATRFLRPFALDGALDHDLRVSHVAFSRWRCRLGRSSWLASPP
jgi:hypothetical protein